MSAKIEAIKESLKHTPPGVTCEYGEAVQMFWTNPWSKQKELLATVMWPTHPIEATGQVEQWFENMGKLWESAPEDLAHLLDRLEKFEYLRLVTKIWQEYVSNNGGSYLPEHAQWINTALAELENS